MFMVPLVATSVLEGARLFPYFEATGAVTNRRAYYGGEIFLPAWQRGNCLLFFDGRAFFDSKERFEGNVGFGYRQMLFSNSVIAGANIFGDIHRSRNGFTYQQVSFGVEWMTDYFEFRGNVFLPDESRNTIESIVIPEEILEVTPVMNFVDIHKIPATKDRKRERALSGVDLEAGIRIPVPYCWSYLDLWLYGGWYRYNASNTKALEGGRGRIELQVYEPLRCIGFVGTRMTLEAGVRGDDVRDTEGYFALRFALPLYECLASQTPCGLRRRMSHRVVRHEQVITNTYFDVEDRVPVTERLKKLNGDDVCIIYVDGEGTGGDGTGGDGTVEMPYGDLADGLADLSEQCDILYITEVGTGAGLKNGEYVVPPGIPSLRIVGEGSPLIVSGFTLFDAGTPPVIAGTDTSPFILDVSGTRGLTMNGFTLSTKDSTSADEVIALRGEFDETAPVSLMTLSTMTLLGNSTTSTVNPNSVGIDFHYQNGQRNLLFLDDVAIGGTSTDSTLLNEGVRIFNERGTLNLDLFKCTLDGTQERGFCILNEDRLFFAAEDTDFRNCTGQGGLLVENFIGSKGELVLNECTFDLNTRGMVLVSGQEADLNVELNDSTFTNNTVAGVVATATGTDSILDVHCNDCRIDENEEGLQLNGISSGVATLDSFDSTYIKNIKDDLFLLASLNGKAILNLNEQNIVDRIVMLADDGEVEATRTVEDTVLETQETEVGTGTITTDPTPFANP